METWLHGETYWRFTTFLESDLITQLPDLNMSPLGESSTSGHGTSSRPQRATTWEDNIFIRPTHLAGVFAGANDENDGQRRQLHHAKPGKYFRPIKMAATVFTRRLPSSVLIKRLDFPLSTLLRASLLKVPTDFSSNFPQTRRVFRTENRRNFDTVGFRVC